MVIKSIDTSLIAIRHLWAMKSRIVNGVIGDTKVFPMPQEKEETKKYKTE